MSKRSRCGAVRICLEPDESAGIVRVEALSLWRRANLSWSSRRALCGDRACPSALAVAPCESVLTLVHPLRRSCVSKRSRCGAVRICLHLGEPSAGILRVEALSLWRRAYFLLAKRPLEVVSWFARLLSQSRGRGFDSPLVRGSSGSNIAAFKRKRSTRSGWKIATFKYRRSTWRLLQLRLENRTF